MILHFTHAERAMYYPEDRRFFGGKNEDDEYFRFAGKYVIFYQAD